MGLKSSSNNQLALFETTERILVAGAASQCSQEVMQVNQSWRYGALMLAMPSFALAAPEIAISIDAPLALSLLVMFFFCCAQFWMHQDAHKRPFSSRILLSSGLGALSAWLVCEKLTFNQPTELIILAIILCGTLTAVSHIARLASFEGLRSLLLKEVAQKTITLEEKNLELKSTQRQLRIANIELKALSFTDALTGAYNRLYFDRQFLVEWQRARREQEPLSMILVDIDHFKELNDKHGHLVGDQALKFVTELLKNGFQRGNDIACRYGGEEFVILLPNTPPTQAIKRAEEVRQKIETTEFEHDGLKLSVTASFGIGGMIPKPHHEPLSLLHATGQALYYVKRNGRNGCHLATTLDLEPAHHREESTVIG